jgi:hypothetical protein
MMPAELSPQHEAAVVDGAVSLSFDLPRFGVSLLTLSPPNARGAEASPGADAACSCRLPSASGSERSTWLTLALVVALAAGRSLRRGGWRPPLRP